MKLVRKWWLKTNGSVDRMNQVMAEQELDIAVKNQWCVIQR